MIRNRFQQKMVTGRFTLPVVVIISTLVWIIAFFVRPVQVSSNLYLFWQEFLGLLPINLTGEVISYFVYGVTGYLLIELNNTFSVIRIRTSLQCTVFVFLVTACSFLFPLQTGSIANLCLLTGIYYLFRTYQKQEPVAHLFHSFLFVSIGSLLFPELLFYIPLFLIGAYNFKSLTFRTFFAGILGLSLPYWFLLGYAYFYEQMKLFYAPFIELTSFAPIDYVHVQLYHILSGAFIIVLFIVASTHSIIVGYQDKIRTRSYLNFLIMITIGTIIYCFLQPQQMNFIFPVMLTGSSLLIGHLFALTSSKLSNIVFIISFLLMVALTYYNLWML